MKTTKKVKRVMADVSKKGTTDDNLGKKEVLKSYGRMDPKTMKKSKKK